MVLNAVNCVVDVFVVVVICIYNVRLLNSELDRLPFLITSCCELHFKVSSSLKYLDGTVHPAKKMGPSIDLAKIHKPELMLSKTKKGEYKLKELL